MGTARLPIRFQPLRPIYNIAICHVIKNPTELIETCCVLTSLLAEEKPRPMKTFSMRSERLLRCNCLTFYHVHTSMNWINLTSLRNFRLSYCQCRPLVINNQSFDNFGGTQNARYPSARMCPGGGKIEVCNMRITVVNPKPG